MEEIRAPRGTGRSCKGWVQEAALRMLMNNLDPEVAERPEDLVVYGGTGKAARDWECYHAHRRERCARSETTRRCSCRAGSRWACSARTPTRPRVLIANSNLVPRWATWEHFRDLERARAHDVRADDRGLVDLHRHAGDPAGHLRDVRAGGRARTSARTTSPGRLVLSGGLGGMGGAQPLAATMLGAAFLGVEVDPAPHRAAARRPATSTRARDDLDDALAPARRERAPRGGRSRSGWSATPPTVFPSWRGAGSRPTSSPTRPPRTIR